jgi:hypothetical protein
MKYIKAIDVWAYGQAIRDGQIKLQSGQWIRLGENGQLSRFHNANQYHITAFHGNTPSMATEKYLNFVGDIKHARRAINARRKARKAGQLELAI